MGKLTGKVAIVTGASRGIGESMAELFAAHGFTVRSAPSDWLPRMRGAAHPLLREHAGRFLTELVLGHAEAARAAPPRGHARREAWLDARLDQISLGGLAARIGHRDVLALPAGRG